MQLFVKLLSGSQEKRIFEWNLDRNEFYGALKEFSTDAIGAMIEALIMESYLFKQS
jgi:superfamily II DNA helicase RecQ